MRVYSLVVFPCCVMLNVGQKEARRLRMRRGACEFGPYQHEGKTCCLCSTGYRVLSDCTDKDETYCDKCEHGTYIDHPNSDYRCQLCKMCNSSANMDTMERCSPYSNTVCRCKENHYCDKGDQCKACYPCDRCEKHGVIQSCTETTNTVCNNAQKEPVHPQSPNTGPIVAVLVLLILVFGVVVFWLWRKHKLCFKDGQSGDAMNHEEDLALKGLELNPHLSEIADVLGWKTMKRVAQCSGMSKTDIEEHELNHHNDVKEQTFALLQDWSQRQGVDEAYPALIKTLHEMQQRRTADELQKIIEKGSSAIG